MPSSSTRYIHIDSTYRDRNKFPLPSEFVIDFSHGLRDRVNAVDPVSEAAPQSIFTTDFNILAPGTGTITTGVVDAILPLTVGATSNGTRFVVAAPVGSLFQIDDYYAGAVVRNTTTSVESRIIASTFLNTSGGSDRMILTVSPDNNFNPGDALTISNPTDLSDPANPLIFVPGGSNADNFYVGLILYNQTVNDWRPVCEYDGTTHIMTLDTATMGPIVGWTATDTFVVREEAPNEVGTLTGGSTTTFTLPATSSMQDRFYVGDFLRITTLPAIANTNEIRRIVAYDGATQTGTVTPAFPLALANTDTYEILQFTRDNDTPINYTGSIVSQSDMTCWECELLNLVLPNTTLAVGRGSRLAFYPYVLVEFGNADAPGAGQQGILYSNNPHATRSVFTAIVDDLQAPLITPFVRLKSSNQVVTMKFKPTDKLRFAVRLPCGDLIRTQEDETVSPEEPNPSIQISATIAIRQV